MGKPPFMKKTKKRETRKKAPFLDWSKQLSSHLPTFPCAKRSLGLKESTLISQSNRKFYKDTFLDVNQDIA